MLSHVSSTLSSQPRWGSTQAQEETTTQRPHTGHFMVQTKNMFSTCGELLGRLRQYLKANLCVVKFCFNTKVKICLAHGWMPCLESPRRGLRVWSLASSCLACETLSPSSAGGRELKAKNMHGFTGSRFGPAPMLAGLQRHLTPVNPMPPSSPQAAPHTWYTHSCIYNSNNKSSQAWWHSPLTSVPERRGKRSFAAASYSEMLSQQGRKCDGLGLAGEARCHWKASWPCLW